MSKVTGQDLCINGSVYAGLDETDYSMIEGSCQLVGCERFSQEPQLRVREILPNLCSLQPGHQTQHNARHAAITVSEVDEAPTNISMASTEAFVKP